MKHLKMLGLAALAAMALTAFLGAGGASATVLCKVTPTASGGHQSCPSASDYASGLTIEGSLAAGQTATFEDSFAAITCTKSTTKGKLSNTGSTTTTVSGPIEAFTFEGCLCGGSGGDLHVIVVQNGSLEIHHIAGTHDGTLTGKGTTITFNCTSLGVTCAYELSATGVDLGKVTGGDPAIFHAEATIQWETNSPTHNGTLICSGFDHFAKWQGTYTITTPKPIYVAASVH